VAPAREAGGGPPADDEVGHGGGYILAPCHNLQPDTPIANVLALYIAVTELRAGQ